MDKFGLMSHKIFLKSIRNNELFIYGILLFHQKVIPPKEWNAHSKFVDPDYHLKTVVTQVGEDLSGGAFSVTTESTEMTYSDFEKYAVAAEEDLSDMTFQQIEGQHWSNMHIERKYAINNEISLFGNVVLWNLDTLTSKEPNLHFSKPHHHYEVNFVLIQANLTSIIMV